MERPSAVPGRVPGGRCRSALLLALAFSMPWCGGAGALHFNRWPANAPWYVKTETFKPSLSFPEIKPHLAAHKRWVASLRDEGVAITSGYRVDANGRPGGGGLMLFAAEDYAAAERLVLSDPIVANECVDWALNRWIADVGDIALIDGGAWYQKAPAER